MNNGKTKKYLLNIQYNARLLPNDRVGYLEDPIEYALEQMDIGELSGGGTFLMPNGEVEKCDINISLFENYESKYEKLKSFLNFLGAPKGTILTIEGRKEVIGTLEGIAIYLNGTDLEKSVYASCDVNYVVDELIRLLEGEMKWFSHWRGNRETALYFYGNSFERMKELMIPFIKKYPLCDKCRIVKITE